ncbi:MAG: hypothetical protein AAGJ93_10995 [Bacteroidota bacterium]
MQIRPFLALVLLLFCSFLQAQKAEVDPLDTFSRAPIPILIEPMRYPEGLPEELIRDIESTAYKSLEDHWHFQVVNHSEEENTGEVDPEYIFQLSLEPIIDNLSQQDLLDTNKQVIGKRINLTGGISANLRITDIVSGELKYVRDIKATQSATGSKYYQTSTFFFSGGKTGNRQRPYPSTPDKEALIIQDEKNRLLDSALKAWKTAWNKEITRLFPCAIHLVEVLEGSEKKPKVIRVDAGKDFGLRKNVYLSIVTIKAYEAMGETFATHEQLGYYYPKEIEDQQSTGNIFGGRKAVGTALAEGKQVYLLLQQ